VQYQSIYILHKTLNINTIAKKHTLWTHVCVKNTEERKSENKSTLFAAFCMPINKNYTFVHFTASMAITN